MFCRFLLQRTRRRFSLKTVTFGIGWLPRHVKRPHVPHVAPNVMNQNKALQSQPLKSQDSKNLSHLVAFSKLSGHSSGVTSRRRLDGLCWRRCSLGTRCFTLVYQYSSIKMYKQLLRSRKYIKYGNLPPTSPTPSNEAENLRSNFSSGDFRAPCTVASERQPPRETLSVTKVPKTSSTSVQGTQLWWHGSGN